MKVLIVGGGLAGLAAAHELSRHQQIEIFLIEATDRLGGQVWTDHDSGFVIERGAEGFSAAQRSMRTFCSRLGLTDQLVSQRTLESYALARGKLRPLERGRAARLAGLQVPAGELGRGMVSLRQGMGELVAALVRGVPAGRLKPGLEARLLRPANQGWEVATAQGRRFEAQALILAVPAAAAAQLLAPISPAAAGLLRDLRVVSSVTVQLAYRRSNVAHPLDAMGVVRAAEPEREGLRACSFVSSQFPERAPPGYVLLRVFFRPGPRLPVWASDARWIRHAVKSLAGVLGLRGAPARAWVARWPQALPRYGPDHVHRVEEVGSLLERAGPPVLLAGAAYRPAGITGAIASGVEAARRLLRMRRG
jgi:oxygen-dependent protoporphyrinogen oxidase